MAYGVALSKRGPVRPHNEDSCCFMEAVTSVGSLAMGVVCDGVGGLSRGELASSTVVNRFVGWFERELVHELATRDPQRVLGDVQDAWLRLLHAANNDLIAYGKAHNAPLATTFTGVMVHDTDFVTCHVGDCRLYHLQQGAVRQLTHDHTLVAHELALGRLTPEQAHNHPRANVIYQAIGASEPLEPEVSWGTCDPQDLLLLMSDGGYRRASDVTLQRIFLTEDWAANENLTRACAELLEHDLLAGETDNLSVVAMGFGDSYDAGTVAFARRRSA